MTLKEANNGGMEINDIANPGGCIEKLPREAREADTRHLAHGASPATLCGLDRATVSTTHPSKARKTDCPACRDAYRAMRTGKDMAKVLPEPERPEKFKTGDHVEFVDGSVWLVDDVRPSGADVHCLLGSKDYTRGRKLTIGADSSVRVFLVGEFEALVEESKTAANAVKLPITKETKATPETKIKAPKWLPTVEDIAEVKRLRALGLSFMSIEATMEWPDSHGNRPFRICKQVYDYLLKDK